MQVGAEILGDLFGNFAKIHLHPVKAIVQEPGDRQPVAAVIPRTAKDLHGSVFRNGKGLAKPIGKNQRGPLHQVERIDGFLLNGMGIPGLDLLGGEYFHWGIVVSICTLNLQYLV